MNEKNIDKLQETLNNLQMQINEIKNQKSEPNPIKNNSCDSDEYKKLYNRLQELQKETIQVIKMMTSTGKEAIATCIGVIRQKDGDNNSCGTYSADSINELSEDGLATVLEIFSNPRRITILKLLFKNDLTASEITQKTGFVGGQLYHHLTLLNEADLIKKNNESYSITSNAQSMLICLYAVTGGSKLAKNQYPNA